MMFISFMAFSKSYPKQIKGSTYPRWEEISITDSEERLEEQRCKIENMKLMLECIEDAKKIFEEKDLKRYQSDLVRTAISLFEKRASHIVYWKERKCKEKFDESSV